VAVFIAAFVSFIALTGLLRNATRSLTWIGLGTLLALALDPLVSRLQARIGGRRRIAVAIVLTPVSFIVGGWQASLVVYALEIALGAGVIWAIQR